MLTDGTTIVVRSIEPDDAGEIAGKYRQLSATSAYRRFFTDAPELSDRQVRYFTDLDHHDHEAVGAFLAATGDGIGVARYIREDEPHTAEFAIVILDDWQGRGVGRSLLRVLIDRARHEGVTSFRAEFLAENVALPALLRCFGTVRTRSDGATTHASLDLTG
ncbi:L-amino acid N-acyltransferase YncA [Pseudonocardia endophytica]|uniref:L-amino acid N-acyltransferase YncA n=2 Tax=Pseudonocardia endophytica TaxID=401976 RepID=A0A4R1HUK9_PSEEN|nr:L-amino acid N-acyltransferase YncA [Pseudonocardia endophytica]